MKSRTLAWLLIPLLLTATAIGPSAAISVECYYPEREADVRSIKSPYREDSLSTDAIAWFRFWWMWPSYWGWRWAGDTYPHHLSASRPSYTQVVSDI